MDIKIKKSNLKKAILWGIIGMLLVAVVYMTFFGAGGSSTSSLGATSQAAKYSASAMVGSC